MGRFRALLQRRILGEPLAYLVGEREFFGRAFAVDDRVLVPRPETEHLIEVALELCPAPTPRILDLGAGSGCIAVTLAAELPGARVVAVDRSAGCLSVTRINARRHGVEARVRLVAGDWTGGLRLTAFDLVISNPPYVDRGDPAAVAPDVARYEPAQALFARHHGLEAHQELFKAARAARPDCPLVTEIGHGQVEALTRSAADHGWWPDRVENDYAGIPRTVVWRQQI